MIHPEQTPGRIRTGAAIVSSLEPVGPLEGQADGAKGQWVTFPISQNCFRKLSREVQNDILGRAVPPFHDEEFQVPQAGKVKVKQYRWITRANLDHLLAFDADEGQWADFRDVVHTLSYLYTRYGGDPETGEVTQHPKVQVLFRPSPPKPPDGRSE